MVSIMTNGASGRPARAMSLSVIVVVLAITGMPAASGAQSADAAGAGTAHAHYDFLTGEIVFSVTNQTSLFINTAPPGMLAPAAGMVDFGDSLVVDEPDNVTWLSVGGLGTGDIYAGFVLQPGLTPFNGSFGDFVFFYDGDQLGQIFVENFTPPVVSDPTWNLASDGNWNDAASWLLGVPGAGDTALFDPLPLLPSTVTLNGPASVGVISRSNSNPIDFVGDTLTFDTLDPLVDAEIDSTVAATSMTFGAGVVLTNDLRVHGVGDYFVEFSGGIGAGNGQLTNDGIGEVHLSGDSSAWSGDVVVNDGTVVVTHASGLGDAIGQTVVDGGTLELDVATTEPITLSGGEVIMTGAGHANPIDASGGLLVGVGGDLSTPINLTGGTTQVNGLTFSLGGGTTGVGDLVLDEHGIAQRGLLIRHLVLPGGMAGSAKVLSFLAEQISPNTYVNIMAQYRPAYRAMETPPFDRSPTRKEYNHVLDLAEKFGLQRLDSRNK